MKQILCFVIFTLTVREVHEMDARLFIVWDVGQGSWNTLVESQRCWHIDMGGTKFSFGKNLKALCGRKLNAIYLTHFDSDHINLMARARWVIPKMCLMNESIPALSTRKRRLIDSIEACPLLDRSPVHVAYKATFRALNDSNIYVVDGRILITGDAPAKYEKYLARNSQLSRIHYYILGHHGSRTSSSQWLLRKMTNLRMGIASCDKKKFGHPHKEVGQRMRAHHVPLLTTELYGRIRIDGTRP